MKMWIREMIGPGRVLEENLKKPRLVTLVTFISTPVPLLPVPLLKDDPFLGDFDFEDLEPGDFERFLGEREDERTLMIFSLIDCT